VGIFKQIFSTPESIAQFFPRFNEGQKKRMQNAAGFVKLCAFEIWSLFE